MNSPFDLLRSLGPIRLITMGLVVAALVGFFFFLTSRLTTPDMSLLFGDLEASDSSSIVTRLEQMNVPYELRAGGTQVFVPGDQALNLRVTLAGEGLLTGGSVGYEVFDGSDGLTATNFVQNINLVRALEGELARTIRTIDRVKGVRVHLVMPQRQLFSRDSEAPTASVVLDLGGGGRFGGNQIQAIQYLVAAAVPSLSPDDVSVIDTNGNLLARAGQDGATTAFGGVTAQEMRAGFEQRMARDLEALIDRTVGLGNAQARVSAEMDFDRITRNAETYDPDSQVVRSTQTVEEQANSSDNEGQEAVTVLSNLPGGNEQTDATASSASQSSRIEETVNYEISRIVTTEERQSGQVRRLSVALLINGVSTIAEDGTSTYTPRSEQELQQIEALVKTAIGFDESRGDTVEVINLPFAQVTEDTTVPLPPLFFGLGKEDYFRIAEILVLAIVGVLVILLVLRPLITRTLEALPKPKTPEERAAMLENQTREQAALAPPESAAPTEEESLIDLSQVEGRVRASSIKKMATIVDRHPEETVSVMRNWMYQESQG
ncbi:MAG: flagellar basal-body MS-ring/collar protein FliF [Alphaproteobacteria bacterium]